MTLRRAIFGAAAVAAALVVAAIAAASASAVTLHACEENKAGATAQEYTGATCETKGVGKFRTVPVTGETLTTPALVTNQVITATIDAVTVEIVCKGMAGSGKSVNSVQTIEEEEVKAAYVKEFKIKYVDCTVVKPAGGGCELKEVEPPIETTALRLEGKPEGTGLRADLAPEKGTLIAKITLEKCSKGTLNGTRELSGEARAVVGADPSILEFTAASGSKLTLGGATASYTGEVRLFMEGSTKRLAFELP